MKRLISAFTALLFVLGISSQLALAGQAVEGQATSSIQVSPQSYDFGLIDGNMGPVSTVFELTNVGAEPISLNRLSTSCGCTTAEMDMSELMPGEVREMRVTFDPAVHPDQSGPVTRVVYLQSSDSTVPEIEIDLSGNVSWESESNKEVVVFFNEACQDCGELVHDVYPSLFDKYGFSLVKRDYINERENRKILTEYNEKWGVPFELQSHIEAFVGDKLLVGGHVPEGVITYLLEHPEEYEKLLVYQDEMHGDAIEYRVWDFKGEVKTYSIEEPIETYLREGAGIENSTEIKSKSFWGLFAIVSTSAFLDGINPCAISVLLFFVAFLFSIKSTKKQIWKMGIVYIFAIYLAYLLIGLGLAQAIVISGAPHLMAYVGAYLVIALGIIQLISIAFPSFPIKLRIPVNTKATVSRWLHKGTLPAAFVGGFVVGLCTFPCSGGIYVAIIGMLSSSQSYSAGLLWMLFYNLVFVLPLIILLVLAANPKSTGKLQKWERSNAKGSKIIIGLTMLALGAIILLFFV